MIKRIKTGWKRTTHSVRIAIVGTAFVVPMSFPVEAQAEFQVEVSQERYDLLIDASDLEDALNSLAKQTQTAVLYPFDDVINITAPAIDGSYTVEQALEILLQGTGFLGILTPSGAITIVGSNEKSVEEERMSVQGKTKKALEGASVAIIAAAMGVNAEAQEAPPPEDEVAVLGAVTVTAQKREQSAQDIPLTVETFSGANLEAKGVDNLFDLANVVPGVVFSRAPDDGLALTIRGLGTAARTQSFDQSIALFLDGMFVGKGRMYSGAFFDIDRVEVIKGTQSTLLGKNSSLGAISLVTRKPGDELGGNLSASYDLSYGGWIADGGIDIPLSDILTVRAAGHLVDREGWVENVGVDKNSPRDREVAGRITALLEPTDTLDFTFMYQYSDFERNGNGYQFVSPDGTLPPGLEGIVGEAVLDDIKNSFSDRGPGGESYHDTDVQSVSLTANLDAMGHTFTSVTSMATYDLDFVDDFDFGVLPTIGTNTTPSTDFLREETYDQFSQEFRVASPTGQTVEYLAGLFYFNSEWDSVETQIYETPFNPTPDPMSPVEIFNGTFANDFTQETETVSLFGSVTVNATDQLRLIGGLRYTDESKDHTFGRRAVIPTFWTTVVNPPFAETALPFDDDFVNGNAAIQYDLNDDVMLYASYGVGTKTGGFAESAAVPTGNPLTEGFVGSETATAIEAGFKSTLMNGAARLNAAVFYTEVEDFQETSFSGASFDTINSQVEASGAELSFLWRASENLTLDTAWTFVDAEVAAGNFLIGGAATDFPARNPAQSPEITGHFGLIGDWQLNEDWDLNGSVYFRHRAEMIHQYIETFASEELSTFDMTVGLSKPAKGWNISLIGTNLTDEVSADFSGPPASAGIVPPDVRVDSPSRLRTVLLQVRKDF